MPHLHEYDTLAANGGLGISVNHFSPGFDTGGSPCSYREFGAIFSSNQPSAANGARIQASDDGVTYRDVAVATISAGVPQTISAPVCAKFMRAAYTNGATASTLTQITVFRRRN